MRITNNMLINNMINHLGNNLGRMASYQNQLATGKKISVPSDDPVVAARALKLRTDVAEIKQYKRNVDDARSWMEISESAMSDLTEVFQRVRELSVKGSNGAMTPEDTGMIAREIEQLKEHVVHLANSTYAGRYVFSGYKTDTSLINEDGTFAIDVENIENINYEIGIGDSLNINIPGGDLFNSGADAVSGTKGKMTETMDNLILALDAGDTTEVNSIITDIDSNIENILRVRADAGARVNRLELTANRLDQDGINFEKLMSENEDVDMAETIMGLQNEENVYRASLAGGARIILPTLIDFLR